MTERSPNFPSMPLEEAIDAARTIYQKEGRSVMPRSSAVAPLGYSSINGRSLSVLGALRGYGLLEGRGDEVSLTADAITVLKAPAGSEEHITALVRLFENPPAFQLLRSRGDEASGETLRWHLIKSNFREDSAERLVKTYLASRELVTRAKATYGFQEGLREEEDRLDHLADDPKLKAAFFGEPKAVAPAHKREAGGEGLAMGVHERVLQSGMLSKTASYRVIVSGPVGEAEIDRLLRKIEMDREILAEPDPEPHPEAEEDLIG